MNMIVLPTIYPIRIKDLVVKAATFWYREKRDKHGNPVFEFNHLEVANVPHDQLKPTPKTPAHASWVKANWKRVDGTLTRDITPRFVPFDYDQYLKMKNKL